MNDKVLLIDDEEDHRFIMSELLKEGGITNIVVAISGEEGLEMIEAEKPAVVVTDTYLGKMNGFEVCKAIKEKHKDIKVIVITGQRRHVDFVKAKEVGADEYTVKTGDCADIIWKIKRCLHN